LLKLHQIYFRKLIILFVLLFFVVGGIIYYWMQNIYISNIKNSLKDDIKLIELSIKDKTDLDKLVKIIRKDLGVRATIISDSGLVLAESNKDKNSMDNHRYRPEVMQAIKSGYGYSIRESVTLKEKLLYVTKKCNINGKIIYIRLAKEIRKIYSHLILLGSKIAIILILFFLILFYIMYKIGKDIEFEVNKISKFLINLTKKKKKVYISSDFSDEFFRITKLLTKVAGILAKRDKQKAKYTAKLKMVNNQKDDIISAISHEFKNPITVINGYSKTLLEDENIDKNISHKFLQKIYDSGEKLSCLIDTLRLSIKLDSESLKPKFTEIELYGLVVENVDNLRLTYKDREIVIEKRYDKTIKVDRVLMSIAISNLVENAIKYSDEVIKVIIDEEFLSVDDQGIGIDKDEIKNITKKFYRVSKNNWNNSLGLGLSIVSNILSLHNFKLEIKSKKGEGSSFIIIF